MYLMAPAPKACSLQAHSPWSYGITYGAAPHCAARLPPRRSFCTHQWPRHSMHGCCASCCPSLSLCIPVAAQQHTWLPCVFLISVHSMHASCRAAACIAVVALPVQCPHCSCSCATACMVPQPPAQHPHIAAPASVITMCTLITAPHALFPFLLCAQVLWSSGSEQAAPFTGAGQDHETHVADHEAQQACAHPCGNLHGEVGLHDIGLKHPTCYVLLSGASCSRPFGSAAQGCKAAFAECSHQVSLTCGSPECLVPDDLLCA